MIQARKMIFLNVQHYSKGQDGSYYLKESHVSIQKSRNHFTRGFIKDIVAFDTLKFELTEELLAEGTGVSRDGELWFKNIPFSFNPKDFLLA